MEAHEVQLAGLDEPFVNVPASVLHSFTSSLRGPLLRPGGPEYDEAVLIWNGMVQKKPAMVVRPQDAADVQTCVRFARDNGVMMSVKGGGHNIAGTSLTEGGLTLAMSDMKKVEVDSGAKVARVGAGCLLKDVDSATQEHGLVATLGFVSETGVAGLTLGGGFGYLTRKYGWTVDDLEEVQIVTADGELRRASRDENADLFWAIRGGGGNFGIVTEFTFRLHDLGPQILGGLIAWSAEHAPEVLNLYREVAESSPRELTMACTQRMAPPSPVIPPEWHGKPIVGIVACHTGALAQAEQDLARIKGFGEPIVDVIVPKTYCEQQSMLDATQPKGMNYYWKAEFLPALTSELLDTLKAQAAAITSPMSQCVVFQLEGALREMDSDNSFGNRDAHYACIAQAAWPPADSDGDRHRAWARQAWEAFRPFSTGGNYMNFQTDDEDESRTRAAYGDNYARLARVKTEYDPQNLFRTNRNIAPA